MLTTTLKNLVATYDHNAQPSFICTAGTRGFLLGVGILRKVKEQADLMRIVFFAAELWTDRYRYDV